MKRRADVVIIGGGCMGASAAYHLARRGVRDVVLVERAPVLGAGSTGRNAGGVRHQFSHDANVRLSIESIATFERFQEEFGSALDFHQHGYLFLLSSRATMDAFARHVAMQRRFGVDVSIVDPGEVQRLAPGVALDGVRGASYCPRDGIADPNGVTMGFARRARELGVEISRDTEALAVEVRNGTVCGVRTSRGDIATAVVLDAAGAWAAEIGRMAAVDLPVSPLRRHIFIGALPQGGEAAARNGLIPSTRIMVIDFETTFYFHREGDGVLFGMGDPTDAVTFDTTVQWEVLDQVVPVAVRRLPALGMAAVTHAWAGLYEMTPDAMPIIGPVPEPRGFFVVAGFSGHGFQHSPAAGRLVADAVTGTADAAELAPFALSRFESGSVAREANVV